MPDIRQVIARKKQKSTPAGIGAQSMFTWDWMNDPVEQGLQDSSYLVKSDAVYAAVHLRSKSLASLHLKLYHKTVKADGEEIVVEVPQTDPAAKIVRYVNPNWSRADLLYALETSQGISGQTFLAIEYAGSTPVELWWINPNQVRVVPDKDDYIRGYVHSVNGRNIGYAPDEMLWIRRFNMLNEFTALSPIAAARLSIDMRIQSKEYASYLYQNRARPDYVISSPKTVDDVTRKEVYRMLDARHRGARNSDRPMLLGDGAKVDGLSISPRDAEWLAQQNVSLEDIGRVLETPPALLGHIEGSTYANLEQAIKHFWQTTIVFEGNFIADQFTEKLLPLFGSRYMDGAYYYAFDYSRVLALQENSAALITELNAAIAGGQMSIDEARQRRGQKTLNIPGVTDILWLPNNLRPAELAAQPPPPPPAPIAPVAPPKEPPPDKAAKSWTARRKTTSREAIAGNGETAIAKYLQGQADKAATRAKKGDLTPEAVIPASDATDLQATIHSLYVAAGHAATDEAKEQTGVDLTWDIANPYIQTTLDALAERCTNMTDTTREQVKGILAHGLGEGQSISAMAKAIQEELADAAGSRAKTIARTETQYSYNHASLAAYDAAGVTKATLLDSDNDPQCKARNNTVVSLKDAASVVSTTHPNCVLAVAPVIE